MPGPQSLIRKFKRSDRDIVRHINYTTALLGESAEEYFADQEIFADAMTRYFTDFEPQSCFVAEINNQVAGYLIGACDEKVMDKVVGRKVISPLILKAFLAGTFLKPKNICFFMACLRSFFKGEFAAPSFYRDYPAILHINLKEGFRGQALGARLMEAYVSYLKAENVKGVHLCTMSDKAAEFFTAQGFTLLYESKRSYFYRYLKRDVPARIFGRKIA